MDGIMITYDRSASDVPHLSYFLAEKIVWIVIICVHEIRPEIKGFSFLAHECAFNQNGVDIR